MEVTEDVEEAEAVVVASKGRGKMANAVDIEEDIGETEIAGGKIDLKEETIEVDIEGVEEEDSRGQIKMPRLLARWAMTIHMAQVTKVEVDINVEITTLLPLVTQ